MVRYRYDGWGNHVVLNPDGSKNESSTFIGNINPFRYRGYYYDTTLKLYYLKTRYYDPETGRFITIDDISYLAPDTINGLNLYAYCGNNPVMRIDANGNAWWEWLLGGLIIIAGIGLSLATGGLATSIAGLFGAKLLGTIVGGFVAGAVGGAISAFGFSIGTQVMANGFNNIDWNRVGRDVLIGAISGAITGAVFGAVNYAFDVEKAAKSITGIEQAKANYNEALAKVGNTPISFKGGTMSSDRVIAVLDFNRASFNLGMAQSNFEIFRFVFNNGYKLLRFIFKQLVGGIMENGF